MIEKLTRRAVVLGLLVLVASAGCQNTWWQQRQTRKTVRSMKQTYEYMGTAAQELQATNAALDRLPSTPDLNAWMKEYNKSVADLQKAAANARTHWLDMKENSADYIAQWDEEMAETKNPEIKETMEQRQERVKASFDRMTNIAVEVRDSYQPYVQDLVDIQKALTADLTPNAVKALEPSIAKAKKNGEVVLQKLDALGQELNKLTGGMSPKRT
jgi:hypothetical protein